MAFLNNLRHSAAALVSQLADSPAAVPTADGADEDREALIDRLKGALASVRSKYARLKEERQEVVAFLQSTGVLPSTSDAAAWPPGPLRQAALEQRWTSAFSAVTSLPVVPTVEEICREFIARAEIVAAPSEGADSELQQKLNVCSAERDRLSETSSRLVQKYKEVQSRVRTTDEELDRTRQQLAEAQRAVDLLRSEVHSMRTERQELEGRLQASAALAAGIEQQGELATLRSQLAEAVGLLRELGAEHEAVQALVLNAPRGSACAAVTSRQTRVHVADVSKSVESSDAAAPSDAAINILRERHSAELATLTSNHAATLDACRMELESSRQRMATEEQRLREDARHWAAEAAALRQECDTQLAAAAAAHASELAHLGEVHASEVAAAAASVAAQLQASEERIVSLETALCESQSMVQKAAFDARSREAASAEEIGRLSKSSAELGALMQEQIQRCEQLEAKLDAISVERDHAVRRWAAEAAALRQECDTQLAAAAAAHASELAHLGEVHASEVAAAAASVAAQLQASEEHIVSLETALSESQSMVQKAAFDARSREAASAEEIGRLSKSSAELGALLQEQMQRCEQLEAKLDAISVERDALNAVSTSSHPAGTQSSVDLSADADSTGLKLKNAQVDLAVAVAAYDELQRSVAASHAAFIGDQERLISARNDAAARADAADLSASKLRARIDELSASYAADMAVLQQRCLELEAAKDAAASDACAAQAAASELRDELEAARRNTSELDATVSGLNASRGRVAELEESLRTVLSAKESGADAASSLRAELAVARGELERLRCDIAARDEDVTRLTSDVERAQAARARAIAKARDKLREQADAHNTEVLGLRAELNDAIARRDDTAAALAICTAELASLRSSISGEHSSRIAALEEQLEDVRSAGRDAQRALQRQLATARCDADDALRAVGEREAELRHVRQSAAAHIAGVLAERDSLGRRVTTLQSALEEERGRVSNAEFAASAAAHSALAARLAQMEELRDTDKSIISEVRRACEAAVARVRAALELEQRRADRAVQQAAAALSSKAALQSTIATLRSQLQVATEQVESGKVQVQLMVVQLQALSQR
jgi:chromosome segregation ATPase